MIGSIVVVVKDARSEVQTGDTVRKKVAEVVETRRLYRVLQAPVQS
tara:strand:+ start:999 stop:1136 length:138 start_codon:yes stop_codon:yes gene_type:complete